MVCGCRLVRRRWHRVWKQFRRAALTTSCHLLLPPQAAGASYAAGVDLAQRELEKESKLSELRNRLESEDAGKVAAQQLVQGEFLCINCGSNNVPD